MELPSNWWETQSPTTPIEWLKRDLTDRVAALIYDKSQFSPSGNLLSQKRLFMDSIILSYVPIIWYILSLRIHSRLNKKVAQDARVNNASGPLEVFLDDSKSDAKSIEIALANSVLNPLLTLIFTYFMSNLAFSESTYALSTTAVVTFINFLQSLHSRWIAWDDYLISQRNWAQSLLEKNPMTITR
jgi:hypothetical protein